MAERRTCKGCQEVYHIASFFRHVSYTKTCKEAYGEEWPKMLKEKKKLANKRFYEKNKEKLKSKYQEKKEVLKAKHLEKKDEINKQRREKRKNEKAEKYARENRRIRERPGEKVRQHVRILRGRAKKLNSCCVERFPEVWMAKLKQIKKDHDSKSTKKLIKKLKNKLKATEDIFKSVKEEIEQEIQKIFDQLEEKPSLISTYYLNPKKLDRCFVYDVFPKWLELFKTMKKKLSRFMKCKGHESIYYYWSDKTKKYEYWDEESEMLESFEKHLNGGLDPSYDSSDTNSSETDSSSSENDDEDVSDDDVNDDNSDDGNRESALYDNEATRKVKKGPKQCEGCRKTFEFESFLKHVTHKKSCYEKYGEERIQDLKELFRLAAWKKSEKKGQESKLKEKEIMAEIEARKPNHEKFQKELKELEWSKKCEISNAICSDMIYPMYGAIYYYKKINRVIDRPSHQISELVKQLRSDIEDLWDLKNQLHKRLEELTETVHKMPGFNTFVNGDDSHKDVQKKYDDFIIVAREEWSRLKTIVGEKFETLGNLLDIDNSKWNEKYKPYYFLAFDIGDDRKVMHSEEFQKCCKIASKLPEINQEGMATNSSSKESDANKAICTQEEKD